MGVSHLVGYTKEVEGFVFNECLPSKDFIFNYLCNYLNIDFRYNIEFDLHSWIECLIENDLFDAIYMKLEIKTIFRDILACLKEKDEDLYLIFVKSLGGD